MKLILKSCLVIGLIGFCINTNAQKKQSNHWYFGDHYGLDFSTGAPQTDYTSSIYTYESCATVSDDEGNLLFYTNGGGRPNQAICGHIWNSNHEIMEGGNLGYDIGGGYSAAQGVVAFKKPQSDGVYCMLTVDEFETISTQSDIFPQGKGCSYFEIDMSANGGLGEVIVLNQKLLFPAFEYMGATIHADCNDYWAIVPTGHYFLEDDPNVADSFYVFQFTPNGLELAEIVPMPEGRTDVPDEYGMIKITPDGAHFSCGSYLYDFDNSTGEINLSMSLIDSIGAQPIDPIGFSPDSRFMYLFKKVNQDTTTQLIISQYDLDAVEFAASGEIVGQAILSEFAIVGSPQLALDGRLYFIIQEGQFSSPTTLAAIQSPHLKGTACNPNYNILTISHVPDQRFLSFGHQPDNLFKYEPIIPFDLGPDISTDCEMADTVFLFGPPGMDSYLWSNGAVTQNTFVTEGGTYWLEFWDDCVMGVDSMTFTLPNNLFSIDLGPDTTLCDDETTVLSAPIIEDATYLWQDGSDATFFEIEEEGNYWLEVRVGSCLGSDTVTVYKDKLPTIELGPDVVICEGEEVRLNTAVNFDLEYLWQDGSDKAFFMASEPGDYQLTVYNDCGSFTDEITVNVFNCESCKIYIPNVFSPDNNGWNDEYQTYSSCQLVSFQFQIFDRWGNQVFGADDINQTWDGELKGRPCPTAVYAYILHLEWLDEFGVPIREEKTGDILLIR